MNDDITDRLQKLNERIRDNTARHVAAMNTAIFALLACAFLLAWWINPDG